MMEVFLSKVINISKERRTHGVAVLIAYREGNKKKRKFKLLPPAEQLDEWWRKIQHARALCERVAEVKTGTSSSSSIIYPLYYMLEKQLGAEGSFPSVLALRVIDGHVWSASSGLAVSEWRLARERGTDQRRIQVGRSVQLDATELGRRPLLNAMCRVSQQQMWLAVDHQLVPLELGFDNLQQQKVVCAIDPKLCITDLAQVQVPDGDEEGGGSTTNNYVCTVDTGGWLRVRDVDAPSECNKEAVLAVQLGGGGSDAMSLQTVLSVGDQGELWVGGGGGDSAFLRRCRLVATIGESGSSPTTFGSHPMQCPPPLQVPQVLLDLRRRLRRRLLHRFCSIVLSSRTYWSFPHPSTSTANPLRRW